MSSDPFVVDVQVRFRDLDTMGHVNNATVVTYLEQARVAYYRDVLDADLERVGTVIAHLDIDYREPIDLEDSVSVAVWAGDLGESSLPMEYEVRVDGRAVATAGTVQVTWDREAGAPRPLPEAWRERIERRQRD